MNSDIFEVEVELEDRAYPVWVGEGAREIVADALPESTRRVALLTQASIPEDLRPLLGDREVTVIDVGSGEENKSLGTVERICSAMARAGVTRDDAVVAVGGGLVTDVGGFVAASYHRGIPVIHVATSLLAMIDAAIGGKTGVNLPEGKNLVGAFWQPLAVACDLRALQTLPLRELDSGYGEMAKYHFISDDDLAQQPLDRRIATCVAIKAGIVALDEREGGVRAVLNYGHTLGHALEIASDFSVSHGEAVAVGLLYAAHVAEGLGRIESSRVDDHYSVVIDTYKLRPTLDPDVSFEALLEIMRRDKKSRSGLTMVLDGPDGLEVVDDLDPSVLSAAHARLADKLIG